jgi:hypothetical protein
VSAREHRRAEDDEGEWRGGGETGRPQIGEQVLDELLGQRRLADVTQGKRAEGAVVIAEKELERVVIHGEKLPAIS